MYMSRAVVWPGANERVESVAGTRRVQSAVAMSEQLIVARYQILHSVHRQVPFTTPHIYSFYEEDSGYIFQKNSNLFADIKEH